MPLYCTLPLQLGHSFRHAHSQVDTQTKTMRVMVMVMAVLNVMVGVTTTDQADEMTITTVRTGSSQEEAQTVVNNRIRKLKTT